MKSFSFSSCFRFSVGVPQIHKFSVANFIQSAHTHFQPFPLHFKRDQNRHPANESMEKCNEL